MKKVAIVGGGLAGLTAAWQMHRLGLACTLFEGSPRLGGIVETVRQDGFTAELGPDGWITEKPWAAQLARELGLGDELVASNDSTRRTYIFSGGIFSGGALYPIPDGMRLMVPTDLAALDGSPLFSPGAIAAFRAEPGRAAELKAAAPLADESISSFVCRHFGEEVLQTLAAPLLSGVLGGDVTQLSAHAVLPAFVQMERTHGSLILALQSRAQSPGQISGQTPGQSSGPQTSPSLFTTLRSGLATLTDRLAAPLPTANVRVNTPVQRITRSGPQWLVHTGPEPGTANPEIFDHVVLATPSHVTRELLLPLDSVAAGLLPTEASSAILVALGFRPPLSLSLPPGFGFLVPPATPGHSLLACTFADQKFPDRVPPGGRLLRAFFGAEAAETLLGQPDPDLIDLACRELAAILGPLPTPDLALLRRWPRSLPQYAVGHLGRMAELQTRMAELPGLHLLGNSYSGVGLPDIIRDARGLAQTLAQT